jgi:putative membrane protein
MLSACRRLRSPNRWRRRGLAAGIATLAVAFLPPLEDLSGDLASAHMGQHVLLVLVAAPLLAMSTPARLVPRRLPPVVLWLLHAGTVWFWHAAGPYDAAVHNDLIHMAEHGSFLATAVLFWWVVIGGPAGERVSPGFGVLLVFAMAMQSVFLSVLLTFARTPWYSAYAATTRNWHLDPLADQQLAGVIMWIPAGLVYLGAGLALTVAWLREAERGELVVKAETGF